MVVNHRSRTNHRNGQAENDKTGGRASFQVTGGHTDSALETGGGTGAKLPPGNAAGDRADLARGEEMAKFFFLGLEIFFGVRTGSDYARYALNDLHSGTFQRLYLLRIVRQQAHARGRQALEDLGREREVAVVVLEAEAFVGFDGV